MKDDGSSIISLSALKGQGVKEILNILVAQARPGRWLFSPGVITNRNQEEQANEVIREKVFHFLNQEIPYELIVVHRGWRKINGMLVLDAELRCQSPSQQRIVSKVSRRIEYAASDEISKLFGRKIRVILSTSLDKEWNKQFICLFVSKYSLGYQASCRSKCIQSVTHRDPIHDISMIFSQQSWIQCLAEDRWSAVEQDLRYPFQFWHSNNH